ncbi:unnamed protein product, partial [Ixodes pacificus]
KLNNESKEHKENRARTQSAGNRGEAHRLQHIKRLPDSEVEINIVNALQKQLVDTSRGCVFRRWHFCIDAHSFESLFTMCPLALGVKTVPARRQPPQPAIRTCCSGPLSTISCCRRFPVRSLVVLLQS